MCTPMLYMWRPEGDLGVSLSSFLPFHLMQWSLGLSLITKLTVLARLTGQ